MMEGELGPDSVTYIEKGLLLCRAIFLQRGDMFTYFNTRDWIPQMLFWYAMESDIPVIQEDALRKLEFYPDYYTSVIGTADLENVKWNAELHSKMRKIFTENKTRFYGASRDSTYQSKLSYLLGLLGLPNWHDSFQENHLHGQLALFQRGKITRKENQNCEEILRRSTVENHVKLAAVIEAGYMFNVARFGPISVSDVALKSIRCANYYMLKVLIRNNKANSATIRQTFNIPVFESEPFSRIFVNRARKLLQDPEITSVLFYRVIDYYGLATGEILDDPVFSYLRIILGSQGIAIPTGPPNVNLITQTSILYDPKVSWDLLTSQGSNLQKHELSAISYKRGQGPLYD